MKTILTCKATNKSSETNDSVKIIQQVHLRISYLIGILANKLIKSYLLHDSLLFLPTKINLAFITYFDSSYTLMSLVSL